MYTAEAATKDVCLTESLRETRLLSDVMHIRDNLRPDGSVPAEVLRDIRTNIFTAVQETSMPGAVTSTIQRVEYANDEDGRRRRVITWLGKSAIEVAESGYNFHFSEAAYKRVDVEVAEAKHSQESLRAGIAQVFISPKMTDDDAPKEIAKQENLDDADSVRVSYAVTDSRGEVVARRIESLLASGVPLKAWAAMLQDPQNLFGRAFTITNEKSALSVMELFKDLELPDDALPQGPVTLVKAVLPYVHDAAIQASLTRQIQRFEQDQELYKSEAEKATEEWLKFDIELARSLKRGTATLPVEAFIVSLQHQWSEEDLQVINSHDVEGKYIMTMQMAALLEGSKQYLLSGQAAVLTKNEKVLGQLKPDQVADIQRTSQDIERAYAHGASQSEIAQLQAHRMRTIARQNFTVGGGCSGSKTGSFGKDKGTGDSSMDGSSESEFSDSDEDPASWKWKRGVCRVTACGSPKPTEVGPCSVCRNCQAMFDKGQDPTRGESTGVAKPRSEKGLYTYITKLLAKPSPKDVNNKMKIGVGGYGVKPKIAQLAKV